MTWQTHNIHITNINLRRINNAKYITYLDVSRINGVVILASMVLSLAWLYATTTPVRWTSVIYRVDLLPLIYNFHCLFSDWLDVSMGQNLLVSSSRGRFLMIDSAACSSKSTTLWRTTRCFTSAWTPGLSPDTILAVGGYITVVAFIAARSTLLADATPLSASAVSIYLHVTDSGAVVLAATMIVHGVLQNILHSEVQPVGLRHSRFLHCFLLHDFSQRLAVPLIQRFSWMTRRWACRSYPGSGTSTRQWRTSGRWCSQPRCMRLDLLSCCSTWPLDGSLGALFHRSAQGLRVTGSARASLISVWSSVPILTLELNSSLMSVFLRWWSVL